MVDSEDGQFTLEICKNRAELITKNLKKITADIFFKLLFCCQSETDGVNMIVTDKIKETLELLHCSEEIYKNSYEQAMQIMPQIRQISMMRMQSLVTKMQNKPDKRMPTITREVLIEVLKLKIKAFGEVDDLVERLSKDLKGDDRFSNFFQ